ncbi:MAG TPA: hypothetical protein VGC22_04570 [Chitinophaga sp.]
MTAFTGIRRQANPDAFLRLLRSLFKAPFYFAAKRIPLLYNRNL